MLSFAQTFAGVFVALLWVLVFVRVVLSWVDPPARRRVSQVVVAITEPLLAPVRKLLPPTGAFDLSSLLVLVLLGVLWRAFLR